MIPHFLYKYSGIYSFEKKNISAAEFSYSEVKNMTIDTIIFDVGGVLAIDGGRRSVLAEYGISHAPYENDAWDLYKIGALTEKEYWRRTLAGTGYEGRENELATRIREKFATLPATGAMPLIPDLLDKEYRLAILSNHVTEWVWPFIRYNNLQDYFNPIIISSEVKLAKPDLRIFLYAMQAVHRYPQQCIFIDDKEKNILAARVLGIYGILYTNYNAVKQKITEITSYA